MIDYVKVQLIVEPHAFAERLSANGYEVGGKFDFQTGESDFYPLKAWNDTLEVNFKSPDFIQLSGSIHKYAHNDVNHTDFYFNDVIETLVSLIDSLALNPFNSCLHNIEFGVNINPPFETKAFLKQVQSYKGTPFTEMKSTDGHSLGIECQTSIFRIKMYCKKSQYNLPKETMRFEIHVDKMQYLVEKKISIKFLKDLFQVERFKALGELLIKTFNEIVIFDSSIETTELSNPELKVYSIFSNPRLAAELHDSDIIKFQYQRRRWRFIQNKYSKDHQQQIISKLIKEKIDQLLITDEKTSTILTDFNNRYVNANFNHSYPSYKRKDSLIIPPPSLKKETSPPQAQMKKEKSPPQEFMKPTMQAAIIGETKNESTLSIDELRKQGKLIETSFIGSDGKFYIPNPIQPERIAVYDNPEAYNNRLHIPTYIDKEAAEKQFLKPLPVNVQTLQTVISN